MKQYIVFTQVNNSNNDNIYPNLVEAKTFGEAVDKVLKVRSSHEAIGLSSLPFTSTFDIQMFSAVTKLIPPGEWTLGGFVKADTE